MATNEFLAFATGVGANVESQATYSADPNRPLGNQPGIASSAFNNKALRQACYIASQIAQFLVNQTGQNAADDATPANLQNLMSQVWPQPTGSFLLHGAVTPPVGYLLADGSAISRTTYANLFSVIGTTYGTGNGTTTFNIADARGLFARGAGTNGTLQDATGAFYTATLGATQDDQFQGHFHGGNGGAHTHSITFNERTDLTAGGGSSAVQTIGSGASSANTGSTTPTIAVSGPTTDGANGTPRTGAETRPANFTGYWMQKI